MPGKRAAVIGAGIVGLACARALAEKGYHVDVFEKSGSAMGASVRNFGLIWMIGQGAGKPYSRAVRSREIWLKMLTETKSWYDPSGSLQLAYEEDEWLVHQELYDILRAEGRNVELLNPGQVAEKSRAVRTAGLKAALYSNEEIIVDPRQVIPNIARYLVDKYSVRFYWDTCVTEVEEGKLYAADKTFKADLVFACSGADFNTLFPSAFAEAGITKCKLQMMRLSTQPDDWRMGPVLCAGLSLIHYDSFKAARSLPALKQRFEAEMPEFIKHGIHVMAAQNEMGEIAVGDSHEYGPGFDPFNRADINKHILDYLNTFAHFPKMEISSTWHGIYSKMTNGGMELVCNPQPGVYLLNGLGGGGMTQSFALAEDLIESLC